MNLGQAVAVCCYELTRMETPLRNSSTRRHVASAGELEMSLQLVREVLREAEFVGPNNEAITISKLRQRLLRLSQPSGDAPRPGGFHALRSINSTRGRAPQPR